MDRQGIRSIAAWPQWLERFETTRRWIKNSSGGSKFVLPSRTGNLLDVDDRVKLDRETLEMALSRVIRILSFS
jgi:hypothetical protein